MNQFDGYSLLFFDSLLANLAINLNNELIIYSMKILGTYNNLLIVIIATIASMIAISINYFLGRILSKISFFVNNQHFHTNYQLFRQFITKYQISIICLMILPFGEKFIPLIAGFTKLNFIKIIVISLIIKLCCYSINIYI